MTNLSNWRLNTMHRPDDLWVDDTIGEQIRREFEIVSRVAVIEADYASLVYVGKS